MGEETNLHAFARRYCMKRRERWIERYRRIEEAAVREQLASGEYRYTDEAHDVYPRYNILQAILNAIETLDPERLPEIGTLANVLISLGFNATDPLIGGHDSAIANNAEVEERTKFSRLITRACTEGVPQQETLFYRRVLSESEVTDLWTKTSNKWGITTDGWYPLTQKPRHLSLDAYSLDAVDEPRLQTALRLFMMGLDNKRIFELREFGPNYLRDADADDFYYNGAEGYWVPATSDWIVYCSHEATITLGGSIASTIRPTAI